MSDESLEKIRAARRKIEDLTAQIPEAMDAERRRIEEASRVRVNQQRAELEEKIREDREHAPKRIGWQDDIEFRPDGKPVPESIGRVINEWNDGYGNIIFTGRGIYPSEIHELSRQISAQREAFSKLSAEERSPIEAEFAASKGKAGSSKPYSAYLQSEALAKRFQELEQNPPMPFGRKP